MNSIALFVATFLACVVEAVEATTIVLATGTARDWRSAMKGVAAGVAALIIVVAVAGPAITLLPLSALRIVVGGILLIFGLQWMRKAILRASGYKALHDESAIFQRELAAAEGVSRTSRGAIQDWYAFTLSFKGVLLEGLEVVFIVITFGANAHRVGLASLAAVAAVALVVTLGVIVRGPLSRVPENSMKFVVGILLTAFGLFWSAEGAGAEWPGADAALLVIAPVLAIIAIALVYLLRRHQGKNPQQPATAGTVDVDAPAASSVDDADGPMITADVPSKPSVAAPPRPSRLKAVGLFAYDFVIGDDWRVAALVVLSIALTALIAIPAAPTAWIAAAIIVLIALPYGVVRSLK